MAELKPCPFCGRKHEHRNLFLNIICPCGAKYYACQDTWLNRKTGEWRTSHEVD